MKQKRKTGEIDWYPSLNLYMMGKKTYDVYHKSMDVRYRRLAHFSITNKEVSNAE